MRGIAFDLRAQIAVAQMPRERLERDETMLVQERKMALVVERHAAGGCREQLQSLPLERLVGDKRLESAIEPHLDDIRPGGFERVAGLALAHACWRHLQ